MCFLFVYLFYLVASGLLCGAGSRGLRLSCREAYGVLVPPPGIELVSPALDGGFLTTRPPGKSPDVC